MIQALVFVTALFLALIIFVNRKKYVSLLWVINGMLLLNASIIVIYEPQIGIWRWLIFSLLFAALFQSGRFNREFSSFPLKKVLIIAMLGTLVIALLDSRLSIFNKFYIPFREITEKYLLLFLGYFFIREKGDLANMSKPIFAVLIIISIYGLINYVSGVNPYFKWAIETFFTEVAGSDAHLQSKLNILDSSQNRFRAVSTFSHTFDYGYASSLLALFFFARYNIENLKHGRLLKVAFMFGLAGTVLCFSRIVLFAALFAFGILILFSTRLTKKIAIAFSVLIFGFAAYATIPAFQKTMDNTMDVFVTGGEEAGGSSIDMRLVQLAGAYWYFMQSPIIGNGYGYIEKELGWGERNKALLDSDMYGFESVVFVLLIEQGIIGLLYHLVLLFGLIRYFRLNLKSNKVLASLGLSIVSLFFLFAVGTGELSSWPLTMLFLGMIIKTIVLSNKNLTTEESLLCHS